MSLRQILGQETAVWQLQQAIRRNAIPSGYLFVGPEGVGKRLTAIQLAKALNCEHPLKADACDTCSTCLRIDHGNYPDLVIVEPEGLGEEIRIETMRRLMRLIGLSPMEARSKVCIIDPADRLNEESSNAFLKTLEEPPPPTVFLLLARDRSRILPTIASRCQELRFQPLPIALVAKEIKGRLASIAPGEAETLARWSGGGLGKALQLAGDELVGEKVRWIEWLANPQARFEAIERLSSGRSKAQRMIEILISWYHDLLMMRLGVGEMVIHQDVLDRVRQVSVSWSTEHLLACIEHLERLYASIDDHVNVRLTLTQLILGPVLLPP